MGILNGIVDREDFERLYDIKEYNVVEDADFEIKQKLKAMKEREQFICKMHNRSCDYGICDECPLTTGGSDDA